MKLIEFSRYFPTEESCEVRLRELREKSGIVCSRCGNHKQYWNKSKKAWVCSKCHHETTLTSGTVMMNSNLPLMYWFYTIHLLTSTKKSFSALEIQRQLGHKRYQPIWEMVHKLRDVMGQRDNLYRLAGMVEIDDGFFSTETEEDEKNDKKKRGRGTQSKTPVLVMAESTPGEGSGSKKHSCDKAVGHIKMVVLPDFKAETAKDIVRKCIKKDSEISSDASKSYIRIKEVVKSHSFQVIKKEDVGKVLPWVHIAISNAKRLLLDTYHSAKPEFIQNYLNEFCYMFNRRYFGDSTFDRLMLAAISYKTNFTHRSYHKANNG